MLKNARLACLALAGLVLVLFSAAPHGAYAQDVEYLGSNRDWHAFQYMENGNPVCYIASKPTSEEGNYTSRGDVFLLVTHRPGENSTNVVSILTGYTYESGSEVEVTIGNRTFSLFTDQDTAWATDEDDQALIEAMKAGTDMVVRGTSSRGTLTTDTYSLLGFTASHEQINQTCGV